MLLCLDGRRAKRRCGARDSERLLACSVRGYSSCCLSRRRLDRRERRAVHLMVRRSRLTWLDANVRLGRATRCRVLAPRVATRRSEIARWIHVSGTQKPRKPCGFRGFWTFAGSTNTPCGDNDSLEGGPCQVDPCLRLARWFEGNKSADLDAVRVTKERVGAQDACDKVLYGLAWSRLVGACHSHNVVSAVLASVVENADGLVTCALSFFVRHGSLLISMPSRFVDSAAYKADARAVWLRLPGSVYVFEGAGVLLVVVDFRVVGGHVFGFPVWPDVGACVTRGPVNLFILGTAVCCSGGPDE